MEVQVISDTVQKFNGESYYFCGMYFQRKGKRLHRVVWEYHNGEIPEGYHVHHVDENRKNNDISNLVLMEGKNHCTLHGLEKADVSRESIKKAARFAPEWHGSEVGCAWHSEHANEYWRNAKENVYKCSFCGKEFSTKHVYGKNQNHFCSNKCKTAYRVQSGTDNVTKTCPMCGKAFVTGKYTKQIYCGYECARKKRFGK